MTAKVRLDALRRADLPALFAWINDREQVLTNASYKPIHEADHEAWFEGIRNRPDMRIFAIREPAGGRLIGTCQLHSINSVSRSAELQIRVGETSERNKGYGSDAIRQLLAFAFEDINLHRVYLHVFANNAPAMATYERAGFVREGVLRQAAFVDGAFRDVVVMALLRAEHAPGRGA